MSPVGDSVESSAYAESIRTIVDAAPPLTDEQRAQLAAILLPFATTPAKSAETRSRRKAAA